MGIARQRLSVILPLRLSADREDALNRLDYVSLDLDCPAEVDFVVVDDGSPEDVSDHIRARCLELGFKYHRIASEFQPFSIGRARNYGAQVATAEYILFQDIDLLPYDGFYNDVLNEVHVARLDEFAERFLMFGVVYLTDDATTEFFSTSPCFRKSKFLQYLFDEDKAKIEKFSTGTSVTLWRRIYYLSVGGNDPAFEGWGYEDLEFACRAIRRVKAFPLPDDFSLDYRNFQSILEYRGWKSVYRLFGDQTFQKGLVLFHAWHPVYQSGTYIRSKERNRRLFEKRIQEFKKDGMDPEPLPMPERGISVVFRKNTWVLNKWIAPILGKIIFCEEEMFDADSLYDFLISRNVSRVVFHNPYATERMFGFYEKLKKLNFPIVVCERGALPNSIFFDPSGFNGDSASYLEKNWMRPLEDFERAKLVRYVQDYRISAAALEEQAQSLGAQMLRRKLEIEPGRKVLFVPLQRPTDTVVKYLAAPIGGFDEFISVVDRLSRTLPPEWVVVVKKHPLEDDAPQLDGVIYANDANVNDLVDLCDAMFLINSGVGLIGLMYEKPVIYAGTAFYGHDGLAFHAHTLESALSGVLSFSPDLERTRAFLYYLIFVFYSFGRFETRQVSWGDGSRMTATTNIEFDTIRFPGVPEIRYERRTSPRISESSVIFDRYRNPDGKLRRVFKQASRVADEKDSSEKRTGVRLSGQGSLPRKLRKLRNSPKRFFEESQYGFLRVVGRLL